VSLRILFADDSMTAQNMGKKILSDAGYDVVAVSNGAAAVKKIAEQKPDIIILDVYMPGYTGLEVCEKVRGSMDTLKTPVLLTVGKMEPLVKPEDANRVKADGVIIKPFEASDLLAIVKKFEERIGSEPPPMAQAAPAVSAYEEEPAPAEVALETHTASNRANLQPMVEVPDHMASSAAFGDMLGSEPASSPTHFAVNTPSAAFETSVIVPAPPIAVADETAALPVMEETAEPVIATPVATPAQPEPEAAMPESDAAPEVTVTPVEPETEAVSAQEAAPAQAAPATEAAAAEPAAELPHPHFIPVFKEPEAPAASYEVVPTSAAPVDVEVPREPALQETAEETTRNTVADQVEPGLMSTIGDQVDAMQAQRVEEAAVVPSAESVAEPVQVAAPAAEAPVEVSDADFEARVAAAMAAYSQASEAAPAHTPLEEQQAAAPIEAQTVAESPAEHAEPAEVSSFEYQPAAGHAASVAPEVAQEGSAAHAETETQSTEHAAVAAAGVEAAIPEAAAAAAADSGLTPERANPARSGDPGADHHTIANAIHRVMERLKPELLEEIMKELRSKK